MTTRRNHQRLIQFSNRLFVLVFVNACLLAACAEGGIDNGDVGTSSDGPVSRPDVTEDDGGTSPEDTSNCGVCCPGATSCIDDVTAGVCRANGTGFDMTACGEGQMCTNGACVTPPVCVAGVKSCFNATTQQICRATSDGYSSVQCPESCVDGECVTGLPNGAACVANADCGSGRCRCETADNCATATGYCASQTCNPLLCGDNEACVIGTLNSLSPTTEFDHCVQRCEGVCGDPAFACTGVAVNSPNGVTFADVCYFQEVAPIGGDCASDTLCVGGMCRTDYYRDSNFCTRPCRTDDSCPDNAACVEIEPGNFQCALKCGDGSTVGNEPCPLDLPDDRFDVTCKVKTLLSGGALRVCATP